MDDKAAKNMTEMAEPSDRDCLDVRPMSTVPYMNFPCLALSHGQGQYLSTA